MRFDLNDQGFEISNVRRPLAQYCPVSVLSANQSAVSQAFAKKGCPVGYRAELWKQILDVNVDDTVRGWNLAMGVLGVARGCIVKFRNKQTK